MSPIETIILYVVIGIVALVLWIALAKLQSLLFVKYCKSPWVPIYIILTTFTLFNGFTVFGALVLAYFKIVKNSPVISQKCCVHRKWIHTHRQNGNTFTDFFVEFAPYNGALQKYKVPYFVYKNLSSNAPGVLVHQGPQFISYHYLSDDLTVNGISQ